MKRKILGIIPARGGSKGIKDKNIVPLNGKPLIAWSIEPALQSSCLDRLVVSTDSEKIAAVARDSGAEVIMRPAELAGDTTPSMDVIINVLDKLESIGYVPDDMMLLQCTSPFRTVSHIKEAVERYTSRIEETDSLISVTPLEHPMQWVRTVDDTGYMKNYLDYDMKNAHQRQSFENLYRLNGAIYLVKTDILRRYKYFQTGKTIPYIMDNMHSIDIDTIEDLEIASATIRSGILGGRL